MYTPISLQTGRSGFIFNTSTGSNIDNSRSLDYKVVEFDLSNLYGKSNLYRIESGFDRFEALANKTEEECFVFSSPNQIMTNLSFIEIISNGEKYLPFILNRLEHFPTIWLIAIRKICNWIILPDEILGDIDKQIDFLKKELKYGIYR